jgi:N-acetylglucosaminyldiphosphoundecaprenol N-acetyl-beta-D-mannosaminyltransferase
MIERTDFLGYPVDNVTMDEVIAFADAAIQKGEKHIIGVQNANKMFLSDRHERLRAGLAGATIILPENAVNIGRQLLGKPLKQRDIGGIKIMEQLLRLAHDRKYSLYLLGATQQNLAALIDTLSRTYEDIHICGSRHGYFREEEALDIVHEISRLKPNILFVGMGSPKQELFITENYDRLSANIMLGVGGSFNVLAGLEPAAPKWTKYGLEWLFRSMHDPKKFARYVRINSFFIYKFVTHYLSTR